MDTNLETIIKERYKILPNDLKQVLKTFPLEKIINEITISHSIHIDKAGDLYTEVVLVLLGAEKISDFSNNVKKVLGLSESDISPILADINDKIFNSVRESLKNIEQVYSAQEITKVPETTEPTSREQILSEIENPTPTRQPINPSGTTPTDFAHDFIGTKLTAPVSLPSQKTTTELQKPAPKSVSYSADPYREPLN